MKQWAKRSYASGRLKHGVDEENADFENAICK